jgi:hypothetical protein
MILMKLVMKLMNFVHDMRRSLVSLAVFANSGNAQGPIPKQAGPRARIRPHYQSTGQGDQLRSGRPDHRHAVRTAVRKNTLNCGLLL